MMNLYTDLLTPNYDYQLGSAMPIDVVRNKEGYEVIASVPGFTKEEIKLSYKDKCMLIEASKENKEGNKNVQEKYLLNERNAKKVSRRIYFDDIDDASIKASFVNGELIINVPFKKEVPAKSIVIE